MVSIGKFSSFQPITTLQNEYAFCMSHLFASQMAFVVLVFFHVDAKAHIGTLSLMCDRRTGILHSLQTFHLRPFHPRSVGPLAA